MTEPRDIPLEDDELAPEQGGRLAVQEATPDIVLGEQALTVIDLIRRREKVEEVMAKVMVRDEHYGIPVNKRGQPIFKKPMIFKPGIEVLCSQFMLRPHYEELGSVHRDNLIAYRVRCVLIHWPDGAEISEGLGSANSREKGQKAKLATMGTPDVWELDNNLIKMAALRALRTAILTGTAASEVFSRDEEKTREALRQELFAKAEAYDNENAREDGVSWKDWTKTKAQEEWGISSRSELDDEQWAELIRLLDSEAIPFG